LAILALLLYKTERGHNIIKTKNNTAPWHNNKWWHPSKKYASKWETSYTKKGSCKKMRTCILPKWETSYTKKGSCKKMRTCILPTMTETPESVTTAK
jgi:hypothetical protein